MSMFDDCLRGYSLGSDASVFALLELLMDKGCVSLGEFNVLRDQKLKELEEAYAEMVEKMADER